MNCKARKVLEIVVPFMLALASSDALAFIIRIPEAVSEYYNGRTGHYRLATYVEPNSEWARTGYSFHALGSLDPACTLAAGNCPMVAPQFMVPATDARLFTANRQEIASLLAPSSGWVAVPSSIQIPVPKANGQCAENLFPVVRHYNGRGALGDSNHRYTVTDAARRLMAASGWIDEGVVFCAYRVTDEPLASVVLDGGYAQAGPSCSFQTCLATVNLIAPTQYLYASRVSDSDPYFARTGVRGNYTYLQSRFAGAYADLSFVQISFDPATPGIHFGVHVASLDRLQPGVSSMSPYRNVPLGGSTNRVGGPFAPFFQTHDTETELRIAFRAFVKSVGTVGAGSHAYAMPVVEFRDATTDLRILMTLQTFGTVPPGDFLASIPIPPSILTPQVTESKTLVSTSLRAAPAFGRNLGLEFLATPAPFTSANPWGYGGDFDFRMTREEFRHFLDLARTIEPRLSNAPEHYQVANFQFRVETVGDARIGLNASGIRLELIRRDSQ